MIDGKKVICSSTLLLIALYFILKDRNMMRLENISRLPCEGFQCWLEKKEKLNENVARVCRKHRSSILLPGTPLTKIKRFLKVDRMVNCINEKVS